MKNALYTIGYEGKRVDELVDLLQNSGVTCLVDVRLRAQSRKPGFSKTSLFNACEKRGIKYIHRKDLGTPESIMKHLRLTGEYDWQAYSKHLSEEVEGIAWLEHQSNTEVCCLMCYERSAEDCHRRIIADRVSKSTNAAVSHL